MLNKLIKPCVVGLSMLVAMSALAVDTDQQVAPGHSIQGIRSHPVFAWRGWARRLGTDAARIRHKRSDACPEGSHNP